MQRLTNEPLTTSARRLLLSFFFMGLALPMIGTFTNIFLWRQGKSLPILIAYTLALYTCQPLGFLLSYRLVGRVTHRFLFLLGTATAGLVPFFLIFSPTFIPAVVVGFGAILGFAMGFVWSTRNYLTLNTTTKVTRLRFSSVESVIMTLTGITIPFTIGWGLELGTTLHWFTLQQGYRWMGLLASILFTIAGIVAYERVDSMPKKIKLRLQPITQQWTLLRWMELIQGMMFSISMLLPLMLTLTYIGREGAVGTFGSIGHLVSAFALFIVGRHMTHDKRLPILLIPTCIDLLTAAAVLFLPIPLGITIYLVAVSGTHALRWWVTGATMYRCVEIEQQQTGSDREALLLDRETVLNFGRVIGLGLLLAAYYLIPQTVLFIAPLFVGLLQLGLYPICKAIDRYAASESENRLPSRS